MSDFNKLSEVAGVIDSLHKTPKYVDVGRPMVRCTDVKYGQLDLSKTFKVNDEVFAEFSRRYTPKREDIIITRVGSYGITAIVQDTGFCLGQNTSVIVPKINARYLYLALNSPLVKNQIEFSVVGSTQKTLSLKAINNLDIPRFDPVAEEKIAQIIGGIDDKIELNRQTNQTLEHIAQAIFKSWFVDFEPTRAKIAAKQNGEDPERAAMAAISGKAIEDLKNLPPEQQQSLKSTAALFPDLLVDSELGEIPEEWEVQSIGDAVKRLKPKKRYTKKQVEPLGSVPVYEQGAGILLGFHNNEAGFLASSEEPLFIFGDHTCVVHLSCEDFDISQNVIPLAGNKQPTIWVYYAIQGKQEFQEYRRHWSEFIIKKIIAPLPAVAIAYAEFITSLYKEKEQLVKECKDLEQVRDTLLPKLLSGELDVNDAI